MLGLSGASTGIVAWVVGRCSACPQWGRVTGAAGAFPGRRCLGGVAWAACLVVGEPALSKNPLCIGRETTHPEKYKDLAILAIRYDFSLPLPYIKGLFG